MKKNFIIVIYALATFYAPLKAQKDTSLYRYDTIQFEQTLKKLLTDKIDTSYIRVCIPNNDIKPALSLNYDRIHISCKDGTIINFLPFRTITTDIIKNEMEKKYGKDISYSIGNGYLDTLKKAGTNAVFFNLPVDSSLYYPQTRIYEGIDENGKCWKLILLEYISISYENAPLEMKEFYDFILSEYRFLSPKEVINYRHLPIYRENLLKCNPH